MLVFFVSRHATRPLTKFFETWGAELQPRTRLVYYDDLPHLDKLPGAATYVFADLEMLSSPGLELTGELADSLAAAPASPRILNHPRRALRRYGLLRTLHERGFNPYRIHRAVPIPAQPRFPVFLRSEHDHHVLTPLLRTRRDIELALIRARLRGHDLGSLLLVEFEDTRDEEGTFRLYGAYVIGDAFVPGLLSFDSNWVVKISRTPVEGERLTEWHAAIASREHEPALRHVAELAGIGFGRFDYAVGAGGVCVWELNTNPHLLQRKDHYSEQRRRHREPLATALLDAFAELAGDPSTEHPPAPIEIPRIDHPLVAPVHPRRRKPLQLAARKQPTRFLLSLAEPLAARALWRTSRERMLSSQGLADG